MFSDMKAALFDLDGVLVDTAKYHFLAWRRLAQDLGFDFTHEQNEELKGVSRIESLKKIAGWGSVSLSEEQLKDYATKKNEWYLEYIDAMGKEEILPGVPSFLKLLRDRGIKIALGSASKNAPRILDVLGLTTMFDAIVDGNVVSKSKPDPEVFLKGSEMLGIPPEFCVVFEDASSGVQAGLAAGMKVVGIGVPSQLSGATMVVPGISTLVWCLN